MTTSTMLTDTPGQHLTTVGTENEVITIQIDLQSASHLLKVFRVAGEGKTSPDGYVYLSNEEIGNSIRIIGPCPKETHGPGVSDQRSLIKPSHKLSWRITTNSTEQFGDVSLDVVSFHDTANMQKVLAYAPLKKPGDVSFVTQTLGQEHFNCEYCPKVLAYNVKLTAKIFSSNGIENTETIVRIKFDPMIQTRENP